MKPSRNSFAIWITDVLRGVMPVLLVIALGGCQSSATTPSDRSMRHDQWPFVPQSVRVHPLTRIHQIDDASVLEVWVQLLDSDGWPLRGLGDLSISLDSAGPGSLQQYSWTTTLESGQPESVKYDPVMQGYLLTLDVEGGSLPPTPRIQARLRTPDGSQFTDRLVMDEAESSDEE